ncbi:MAG: response regulator transcription factor [Porticoccus sp.]|nr:response regulator transcription factor [Porticoccus sp.]
MTKRILIVDDDKYFTEDLSVFLEMEGMQADVINTADELFDRVNDLAAYDVVLLDIMFRKGAYAEESADLETGEAFYNVLRDVYPEKPVIVVSAKNQSEIQINFDNASTMYIRKPLSSTIKEVLDLIKGL